jgi:hypothetical protein
MPWRKIWIKIKCCGSYCLRHDRYWEDTERGEDGTDGLHVGDKCPECMALGLKGAEWIAEP